ncbi:MAG TPA: hypothetical protein VFA07_13545 [Chthonomonadaceae bacterium]|nr:hypothetical protein [Chthonomonadaceae bacterium]
MLIIEILRQHKRNQVLGATLGEALISNARPQLLQSSPPSADQIVILDFLGIKDTNSSYLKATFVWLLLCGELSASEQTMTRGLADDADEGDPFKPIPLNVFPLVAHLSRNVSQELDELLNGRKLPCLEAITWTKDRVISARLHGYLDEPLSRTFSNLIESGSGTATQLQAQYPEMITPNAWSNRLLELYRLRLIQRHKESREWIYQPVAKELING